MYRLVCIYDTYRALDKVRVEVCIDGVGKGLSPFQRKLTVHDLVGKVSDADSKLLTLLNQAGLEKQPFRIPDSILASKCASKVIQDCQCSFLHSTEKGSVKRGTIPLKYGTIMALEGHLVSGELYIPNPAAWKDGIEIGFRYEESDVLFGQWNADMPFLSRDNHVYKRDENAEWQLLKIVAEYKNEDGTITLPDYDVSFLKQLEESGWHIMVKSPAEGGRARVTSYQSKTGIVWFSCSDDSSMNSEILLNAYLKGKNFHEWHEGEVALFDNKAILQEKSEDFVVDWLGDMNPISLFSSVEQLSEQDNLRLRDVIKQNVRATLRSYQYEGVEWLQMMERNGIGCLLADEMGLGKTLQVLAHLVAIPDAEDKHLIIAPTSLLFNWEHEIERFVPQLRAKIELVTYDKLRLHTENYRTRIFDTIVIDEAQIIKNRETKKYQAITQLHCRHRIILTGTPIENSTEEVWSHFILLNPSLNIIYTHLLGMDIDVHSDAFAALTGKMLNPFILRRKKIDVLPDLPNRIEKTIYVDLDKEERSLYERIHNMVISAMNTGISGRVNSIVLEGLLRLRQTCVCPTLLPRSLYAGRRMSSKMLMAVDYIESFTKEKRKVLVFSQFTSALETLGEMLQRRGVSYEVLTGETHNRGEIVRRFENSSIVRAFLISLKAGGVGLNLTSADSVILLDDWWNPAVEDQAISRAHRIGQKNNVLVLRFVCKNTVEEKILLLQERKRKIVDVFNGVKERISMDDIKELIS